MKINIISKIIIFIFGLLFLFISNFASAQQNSQIELFYSPTCPHCLAERNFLKELPDKYYVEIKEYNIADKSTIALLNEYYNKYNVPNETRGAVPATFIGDKYFIGFNEDISKNIISCLTQKENKQENCDKTDANTKNKKITLPVIGAIDTNKYSIGLLSVIMGFFDGFNVCSLGAIILILGLVIALKSKPKIIVLGGTYVLVTALIYGILIFVWHQIFLAIAPYIKSMEILIGILSLAGGAYFIREFIKAKKAGPTCSYGNIASRLSAKIQNAFKNKTNIFAMIVAVLIFAALITIIEFPCSAVLPVIYASIITEANPSAIQKFIFLTIYLFFYMLDEIVVFLISIFTMKIWLASPKFATYINLIAAILLFILGIFYLKGIF